MACRTAPIVDICGLGCDRPIRQHILKASFGVGENAPNCCDQPIKFDRFSIELVALCRERLLALASERMGRQRDDGDVAGLWIALLQP